MRQAKQGANMGTTRSLMTTACFACLVLFSGTPSIIQAQTFTDITGWNGTWTSLKPGEVGAAGSVFIDQPVGQPVLIQGPQAHCSAPDGWAGVARVLDGDWPPGVTMGPRNRISGSPTVTGDWFVVVQFDPLECGSRQIRGFTQSIVFRIWQPRKE